MNDILADIPDGCTIPEAIDYVMSCVDMMDIMNAMRTGESVVPSGVPAVFVWQVINSKGMILGPEHLKTIEDHMRRLHENGELMCQSTSFGNIYFTGRDDLIFPPTYRMFYDDAMCERSTPINISPFP